MSDTPINLNRVRKARARAEKRRQADANSVRFGRTKTERDLEKTEGDRAKEALDAHRRDTDASE